MDLLVDGMNCVGPRMKQNLHNANKYSSHKNKEMCHNSRYGNSTKSRSARRKRFVGKMLCEKLAEKACLVAKDLCKGKRNDPKIGKTIDIYVHYPKSDLQILLCLTPADDFTRQRETDPLGLKRLKRFLLLSSCPRFPLCAD